MANHSRNATSTSSGKRRGGQRLERAVERQLDQEPALRRCRSPPAGSGHAPRARRDEAGVHQHVVGEEHRPAPGGQIADQGVGQRRRRRTRPGVSASFTRPDHEAGHAPPAPGPLRMAKSISAMSRKSGLSPRAPEPRPHVEMQQHQQRHDQRRAGPAGPRGAHRAESAGARAGRGIESRRAGGRGDRPRRTFAAASESARGPWRSRSSRRRIRRANPGGWPRAPSRWGRPAPCWCVAERDQHEHVRHACRDWPPGAAGRPAPIPPARGPRRSPCPTGIPLGYTPPRPEDSTSVPVGHRVPVGHAAELQRTLAARAATATARRSPKALPLDGERADPELRDGPRSWRCSSARRRSSTTPISPSGATTGSNVATPSLAADVEQQRPAVGGLRPGAAPRRRRRACVSRRLRSSSWRSRSFSATSDGMPWAR